jgi:4-alpha-glucanotransferase
VGPTLHKLGIPGFRIPMLFREGDGSYSEPKAYPRLSLAQPATHDHPPLAAGWTECWDNIDAGRNVEGNRRELRLIMDFAGLRHQEPVREFTPQLHEAYMRRVLESASWLVVFQITDVFGMSARFNVPGSVSPSNWSHRLPCTVKELDENPDLLKKAELFSRLARESGRVV